MLKPKPIWLFLTLLMMSNGHALTLEESVTRTLMQHPEIARWEAREAAVAAELEATEFAPPIVISAETETPIGADELSDIQATEGTLRLSKVLELGNKRARRREVGQARLSNAALDLELRRVELSAETTRRFTEVVAAQARVEVASERLQLSNDLQKRVERQVAAARLSRAEDHGARMEVARARLEMVRATGAVASARAQLAALWGQVSADFGRPEADLFKLSEVPDLMSSIAAVARNPDLQRLHSESQMARAQVALARSQRRADVTVTAGMKYFGEFNAGGVALGFSLPLGSRARAEPGIRAATAREHASRQALESRRREVNGLVAVLVAQLNTRQSELALLQNAVIPEARGAVQEYQRGFDTGRHSSITLAQAQRHLIETRDQAVDTASDFHRLMIELELLTRTVGGN
jgi:cobalt-zinc-cadmium efflux system outer membrane protein